MWIRRGRKQRTVPMLLQSHVNPLFFGSKEPSPRFFAVRQMIFARMHPNWKR
ncbi:hypothetical protein [Bacillus massilinigeriensis]|uniref:hypothetical protein n=1 Tax=Bacillus massilionigeriensis TaxID=1805475 RepID=UPI0013565F5B|nr:hypothetical protein [Bacillus massilionigeriensis]